MGFCSACVAAEPEGSGTPDVTFSEADQAEKKGSSEVEARSQVLSWGEIGENVELACYSMLMPMTALVWCGIGVLLVCYGGKLAYGRWGPVVARFIRKS